MPTQLDESFTSLPLAALAEAALSRARELGAEHASFRFEQVRDSVVRVRDHDLEGAMDNTDTGFGVQVVHDGTWGFAASGEADASLDTAAKVAEQAIQAAKVSKALSIERIELADEPAYPSATWISAYEINPFDVPEAEKVALLLSWNETLLSGGADHADSMVHTAQENKYYADLAGTVTTQQRIRIHPSASATRIRDGAFDSMRTIGPPTGRGWEYILGTGWDWESDLASIPELLAEKMVAPSVTAGAYDLVIDPSNLWLTIHESIGHATELDRALGYEAAYAGTSFATFDKLGTLKYGSPVMHVTGDRVVEHGLATVGYDDEGVAAQRWDLVKDGMLVGYQLDRRMAKLKGLGRSNGCAFADSPLHVPVQRMANVSLQPSPDQITTADLIGRVSDGIYVIGDRSWSIDMQRYNFQFTGQRFFRIRNGQLAGQLKDVAYQGVTTDFWGSMEAVGGESTYVLGGAFNCGKAQPGQVAAVSHGCPSALFRQVNILNTIEEGGR